MVYSSETLEKRENAKKRASRFYVTCSQHVTLGALSFALESILIVWDSGGICKANFYDRAEVMHTACELMRSGDVLCATCNGSLSFHGSYSRHCKDDDGCRHDGWVAQGRCIPCNKYPALLPEFIAPHKHYKAEVIEGVIAESEKGNIIEHLGGYAADVSTMRRWVRQFSERGAQAVGWLVSVLLTAYERHVGSLKLWNMTLLKQLARLLFEYSAPERGGVIGRVNIILTTQNRGFL